MVCRLVVRRLMVHRLMVCRLVVRRLVMCRLMMRWLMVCRLVVRIVLEVHAQCRRDRSAITAIAPTPQSADALNPMDHPRSLVRIHHQGMEGIHL